MWYRLDEHGMPVRVSTMLDLPPTVDRRIAKTFVTMLGTELLCISTVFLQVDHRHGKGPPLLFETMIMPGEDPFEVVTDWHEIESFQVRYSSLQHAHDGHRIAVKFALSKVDWFEALAICAAENSSNGIELNSEIYRDREGKIMS